MNSEFTPEVHSHEIFASSVFLNLMQMSTKQFYPFKDFSIWLNTEELWWKIHCSLHKQECRFEFETGWATTNGFIFQIIDSWCNLGGYAWPALTIKHNCLIILIKTPNGHNKLRLVDLPCIPVKGGANLRLGSTKYWYKDIIFLNWWPKSLPCFIVCAP